MQKIELWYPRCGLQDIECDLGCLTYSDFCKSMKNCRDWVFSHSGRRPFSCPCSLNVMQCRKEVYATCLSKESMLFAGFLLGIPSSHSLPEGSTRLFKESMPFVNSMPPVPTRSFRFLRAAVRSTIFALNFGYIMPIASMHLQKKDLSNAEKQRVWSRSCGFQDLLECSDCGLSHAIWLLQTNDQLSRLRF